MDNAAGLEPMASTKWTRTGGSRQWSSGANPGCGAPFIRRRVPDPRDVDDILQDVFYELVEAQPPADAD